MILLAGPRAEEILSPVFRPLRSHRDGGEDVLRLGHLVAANEIIDEAVVSRRGGAFEINIHGGPAVAKAAMELLVRNGAEAAPAASAARQDLPPAHPKWDNPAIGAEMLEALAQARSELVVAALAHQWSGGISRLAAEMMGGKGGTSSSTADCPRGPDELRSAACGCLVAAGRQGFARMHRLLHPPEVVLAGSPNAGKSTLANAMVGRQVSIVHDQPRTTRDWVREPALLDGVPIWLTDTAGIWQAGGDPRGGEVAGVEAEAVRRARQVIEKADLVLILSAGEPFDESVLLRVGNVLRVATKRDLGPPRGKYDVSVSALTGEGLDELRQAIRKALGLGDLDPAAPMAFTPRQRDLLIEAAEAVQCGRIEAAQGALRELLAGRETTS